eukprot:CAMPEP_0170183502 /NCGR_PEP_ID=MMETSP0040_2-20121228/30917_1 /TAXON_ID=641309 /ORGANISM="Lotharella oceanica, Strain CCMP622" /LENGTH=61 /DNA_ID=CAMNT_0010429261 /DNA_START=201 /DNA_END=386 /DNA_ORIENTATION=+
MDGEVVFSSMTEGRYPRAAEILKLIEDGKNARKENIDKESSDNTDSKPEDKSPPTKKCEAK